ncbi:MAG: NifB/NifX family molybdenum-iron cluster-binding protein [Lachnospiraceae bacterium]
MAVATDEYKNVYGHFGTATLFTVYSIENGTLAGKAELVNDGTGHDATVKRLIEEGVSVVICGGIGAPAMEGLMSAGILVIPGMQGDIDVAVSSYLDGSALASSEATCSSHDHGDGHADGEGCHCSGGCCH